MPAKSEDAAWVLLALYLRRSPPEALAVARNIGRSASGRGARAAAVRVFSCYVGERTDEATEAVQADSMTSEIVSLRREAPSGRREHYYPWSSRRTTSLRAYDHGIEARQPLSMPLAAAGGQTTGILLVDDLFTTLPLVYLLHTLGYCATRSASCGIAALNLAQDFSPSIALISLQLPDMSAYRVAVQLRSQARGRKIRLIALTSDHLHAARDLARQAGFERYLAKPVDAAALQQLLRSQFS